MKNHIEKDKRRRIIVKKFDMLKARAKLPPRIEMEVGVMYELGNSKKTIRCPNGMKYKCKENQIHFKGPYGIKKVRVDTKFKIIISNHGQNINLRNNIPLKNLNKNDLKEYRKLWGAELLRISDTVIKVCNEKVYTLDLVKVAAWSGPFCKIHDENNFILKSGEFGDEINHYRKPENIEISIRNYPPRLIIYSVRDEELITTTYKEIVSILDR
jgi:hypothetical protein